MSYGPVGTTDRLCDYPACLASYDALAVMEGKARADGWFTHPTFSLHMCGTHAPLTLGTDGKGGGPHCPTLDRGTLVAACSCGVVLTASRCTLGEMTDAYRAHLAEIATESPQEIA